MSAPEPTSTNRPAGTKRRNPIVQRRQSAIAAASSVIAAQLGEANQPGIARLMEIFGADFVTRIAANAREQYEAAQMLPSHADGSPALAT